MIHFKIEGEDFCARLGTLRETLEKPACKSLAVKMRTNKISLVFGINKNLKLKILTNRCSNFDEKSEHNSQQIPFRMSPSIKTFIMFFNIINKSMNYCSIVISIK